ncbi:VOC family protein [Paraburkholderia caffeinilytica]|uniref:VOC family protein n=1 Tax=Paraburkholderia caffeinilytica TaxID=1761016 RepID=UPI003DA05805
MPSGPLAHICLLVKNLDQAIDDWTKILGVLDPAQLAESVVQYEEFVGGADRMRWATFVSNHGAEVQLIEPAPNTPLGRRLEKRGEHVHHLCFTSHDLEGSVRALRERGVKMASEHLNTDPSMPWQKWTWVSAESAHGVLLELAAPYESHGDGKWHPAAVSASQVSGDPV